MSIKPYFCGFVQDKIYCICQREEKCSELQLPPGEEKSQAAEFLKKRADRDLQQNRITATEVHIPKSTPVMKQRLTF